MDKNTAFPSHILAPDGRGGSRIRTYGGMTLRDYFAGQALAGILPVLHKGIRREDIPKMALDCYGIADAMLKAREERT